jgi:hypothetical protein
MYFICKLLFLGFIIIFREYIYIYLFCYSKKKFEKKEKEKKHKPYPNRPTRDPTPNPSARPGASLWSSPPASSPSAATHSLLFPLSARAQRATCTPKHDARSSRSPDCAAPVEPPRRPSHVPDSPTPRNPIPPLVDDAARPQARPGRQPMRCVAHCSRGWGPNLEVRNLLMIAQFVSTNTFWRHHIGSAVSTDMTLRSLI